VEVDWQARVYDPYGSNGGKSDLAKYVGRWKSDVLVGRNDPEPFQCEFRYSEDEVALDVQTIAECSDPDNCPAQHQWPEKRLRAQAFYSGYPDNIDGTFEFVASFKDQRSDLPNLYVFAGEYYERDPGDFSTPYVYPYISGITDQLLLGMSRSFDWNNSGVDCDYQGGGTWPVAVVFVSEIDKLVTDMNGYLEPSQSCGFGDHYSLDKMLARTVYHELFHQLYIASPDDYDPHPNDWCHDGDNVCQCVMNQSQPLYIKHLAEDVSGGCGIITVVLKNFQDPCMENVHDLDGCKISDIVFFN
jgi:hypothetical protein